MAYKKILVTLDGSSLSESVLPHAQAMGRQFNAEVILLQVIPESNATLGDIDADVSYEKAHRYLTDKASALTEDGLEVHTLVKEGDPVKTILSVAEDEKVDLIAMATHGWSGLDRLFYGSVTDRVLRSATHPMLVIRPEST
ncbi:MAG: universal stress protein [Planctomycetota bacterium]|jgi:nucleotide-binding universal stress UspA family protein